MRKMKFRYLVLLLLLLLGGVCWRINFQRTGVVKHLLDLHEGMTKEQVVSMLGKVEDDETSFRLFLFPFKPRLYLEFENEIVTSITIK